eukprot:m.229852 g.229852  ORF g.229852 m.229852 type:complete len:320 (+) comp40051_c0_seq3:310-1269(+)
MEFRLETWMKQLSEEIPTFESLPLTRIALPGTHNSGSSTISRRSTLSGGNAYRIAPFSKVPLIGFAVRAIAARWSRCQSLDVVEQLKVGIRYLDMRITFVNNTFYLCHSLTGEPLEPVLTGIRNFIDSYEKEVVIVDMKHLYNMTDVKHEKLTSLIGEELGDVLFECQAEIPTLCDMWDAGKRVLLLYGDETFDFKAFPKLWPPHFIRSPWPNTTSTSYLFRQLDADLELARQKETFFVSQCLLTPRGSTFVKGLLPFPGLCRNLRQMAVKVMPRILRWLDELPSTEANRVNIVLADYVHPQFVETLININRVKATFSD